MKTIIHLTIMLSALALLVLSSCIDDMEITEPDGPVLVQFFQDQSSFIENLGNNEVTLVFNKRTKVDGVITLVVGSDHLPTFSTTPAIVEGLIQIPVAPGSSTVSVIVNPVDNNLLDGNKEVSFSIQEVSEGLAKGERISTSISIIDDEQPASIHFSSAEGILKENSTSPIDIMIGFSAYTLDEGNIELTITGDEGLYGQFFTTEPAAVNGKINLNVAAGSSYVNFMLFAIDNSKLNGHKEFGFTISSANGGVKKGNDNNYAVKLVDDELEFKLKSFEILAGDRYKETLEYNEDGLIAKIEWEQNTPFLRTGKKEFVYDVEGKLVSMIESIGIRTDYTWSIDRIVKSERKISGVIKEYSEFFYNEQGKISSTTFWYLQPSGEFLLNTVIDYLYYNDGNLHKSIHQSLSSVDGQLYVYSDRTYSGYVQGNVVAPMINILPGYNPHNKLVTYYQVEEYGHTFTYHISYELNETGSPTTRYALSSAGNQTTTYTYY